jgi:hypothetical protein
MSGRLSSFAELLAPVRPELFFERHWESRPLHVQRSKRDYYAHLTNRDVEAAISSGGLRYPAIQLARDGGFFAPEAFTRNIRSGGDVFTGVPDRVSMTDYDMFFDGFSRRVRSARVGLRADFSTDIMATGPREQRS